MPMLLWLYGLDVRLFLLLNRDYTYGLFDWLMPFITEPKNFKWPLVLVFLFVLARRDKRLIITVILLAIGLGLSDGLSTAVKGSIQRVRPCQALQGANILVGCSRSFSFPSNHVANVFMAAFLISARHRGWGYLFFPLALAVGYSRVYVGVHFPSDVLGGLILGLIVARAVLFGQEKTRLWVRHPTIGDAGRRAYEKLRGKLQLWRK